MSLFNDENKQTAKFFNLSALKSVGSHIGGELIKEPYDQEGNYGTERMYRIKVTEYSNPENKELEMSIGDTVNLSIKADRYINKKLEEFIPGDIFGLKYTGEVPSKTKGMNPTKTFDVFSQLIERPKKELPIGADEELQF